MKRYSFAFSSIYLWAAFGVCCLLFSNISILSTKPSSGFDLSAFTILTICAVLCLFTYYFIEHKQNKMKIDWVLLPIFIIVIVSMLIGIWAAKDETFISGGVEFYAKISLQEKIKSTIFVILGGLISYGFYYFYLSNKPATRSLLFLAYIGVIFALVCFLYSFISDFNAYRYIFDSSIGYIENINSFFVNKNMYGIALLVGCLCIFVVNYYKPRFINYLLSIVFIAALLASRCTLATIIGVVATLIYYPFDILARIKRKQYLQSTYPLFCILLILSSFIVFYVLSNKGVHLFVELSNFLNKAFSSKNFVTLTGRTAIWEKVIPHIFDSTMHTLFGHGYYISSEYIMAITANGVGSCHNGFIEIAFSGGLIGFGLYLAAIIYFIYCSIRLLMRKKIYYVFIHGLCVLSLLAHSYGETTMLFKTGYEELFITLLFFMPVISMHKHINVNDQYVNKIKEDKIDNIPMSPRLLARGLGMFLSGLCICSATLLLCLYTYSNANLKYLILNIFGGGLILLLFLPYLVSLWYRKGSKLDIICRVSLNLLLIIFITFMVTYFLSLSISTRGLIKYITPATLFSLLLVETIIYSLICKGSFKEYFVYNFDGVIPASILPIFLVLFVGGITEIIVSYLINVDLMIFAIFFIFNVVIYFTSLYLLSFVRGKEFFYALSKTIARRQKLNVLRSGV